MTRVKICCIASVEEALTAARHGATAIGMVSAMPSGPGVIPEPLIAEITASVPETLETVLLTSRTTTEGIVAQQRRCRVDTIQLCDHVSQKVHQELRQALPDTSLWQVIHVTGEDSITEALEAGPRVDALLLDSGTPNADVKRLGGTGHVHDWDFSARIVAESPISVYLAGGLTPVNVAEAIRQVRPYGVDVCSGVRTADRLDEGKVERFMEGVRS